MKKCLHLKKTKRHWRRKPAPVVTWRDKREAEKKAQRDRRAMSHMGGAYGLGLAAAAMSVPIFPVGGRIKDAQHTAEDPLRGE